MNIHRLLYALVLLSCLLAMAYRVEVEARQGFTVLSSNKKVQDVKVWVLEPDIK